MIATKDTVVLWTGGKDSSMALHEARQRGHRIRSLVTFIPRDGKFKAHPLSFIEEQARSLAIPHCTIVIQPPYASGYESALMQLREHGINWVITGDIAEVDGRPNWIVERSAAVGINVHMPLWGQERVCLLRRMISAGFTARISCVDTRWLHERWVGRHLDAGAINDLDVLGRKTQLDPCGEAGEYHTVVTDGPGFNRKLRIGRYSLGRHENLAYMKISAPGSVIRRAP